MMKFFKRLASVALLAVFVISPAAIAATSPGLGMSDSFVILSGTYNNTASGTTLGGDLGYTVPPAVSPTVSGTTHAADSTYTQAGIDQGTALTALDSQPCTFSFAPGAIDLATDTTHGPAGVYIPGVYCITGAASIAGGGTVTLNGAGTYIFRMDGALATSANSTVAVAGGASACDIWWTPTAATTLGANSTFLGTDIDASGITIGSLVTWEGRALAFGGSVSTAGDTISLPAACNSITPIPTPTPTPTPGGGTTGTPTDTTGLSNTGDNVQAIIIFTLGFMVFIVVFSYKKAKAIR